MERPAGYQAGTTTPCSPSYAGYRFPAEFIGYTIWLYFRFPLSLRMIGVTDGAGAAISARPAIHAI